MFVTTHTSSVHLCIWFKQSCWAAMDKYWIFVWCTCFLLIWVKVRGQYLMKKQNDGHWFQSSCWNHQIFFVSFLNLIFYKDYNPILTTKMWCKKNKQRFILTLRSGNEMFFFHILFLMAKPSIILHLFYYKPYLIIKGPSHTSSTRVHHSSCSCLHMERRSSPPPRCMSLPGSFCSSHPESWY